MSTKDYKTPNEILITLKGDAQASVEAKRVKKKGSIPPGKPGRRFLPRRKQDILINFYDLGQYAGGSDIPFLIDPGPLHVPSLVGIDPIFTNLWTWTNYNILSAVIYASPVADWKTVYKKLGFEDAEEYGLDIYLGSNSGFEPEHYHPIARDGSRRWIRDEATEIIGSQWTADGLKVKKGATGIGISSCLAFVRTHNPVSMQSTKITATNDRDADYVPFVFDKDCNIYLFPMPVFESAFSDRSGGTGDRHILNGFFTTMPRAFYLGRDLNFTGDQIATGTAFEVPAYWFDEPEQSLHPDLINFMKARPEARHFNYYTGLLEPLADFPIPSDIYFAGHNSFTAIAFYPAISTIINYLAPVAVIEKAGIFYYVWYNGPDRVNVASAFKMLPL